MFRAFGKSLTLPWYFPKPVSVGIGYDFDNLSELADEGLVNAGGRSVSASFNAEGETRAQELLKAYGIDTSE